MPPDYPQKQEAVGTSSSHLTGIVVRATGSWYDVRTNAGIVPSKIRGKFRLQDTAETNPVAIGDRVTLRQEADGTGLIVEIHDRHNKLSRRAAGRRVGLEHVIVANIDAAWMVQAVRHPRFNPGFVDRFLVMTGVFDIPAGLIQNKMDLVREKDRSEIMFWHDLYAGLGYPVLPTSARTGDGLDVLQAAFQDKTNVITGPSGAGKSTLLNAIEPGLSLETKAISTKTRKGRHTTTSATLYPLTRGGYVVDTPGLREFGIVDLAPDELDYYFVEFRPFLQACHFPNCTHDHEPDCAVKAAVEEDAITAERYLSYLNILDSLRLGEKDVGR